MIVIFGVDGSNVHYDGITKITVGAQLFYTEYTQLITLGKVLKVDEGCNWIGADLQIILIYGCVAIPGDDDDAFYLFLQLHLKLSTGYTGPNVWPCTACWVSMYKNTTGSATCTTCPGNSSSAAGSTDLNSCVCNVGYTSVSSSPCLPYVAGTYTTSTGNSTCTVCPVGSSSAVTSTALIQCVCNTGLSKLLNVHCVLRREVQDSHWHCHVH